MRRKWRLSILAQLQAARLPDPRRHAGPRAPAERVESSRGSSEESAKRPRRGRYRRSPAGACGEQLH